VAVVAVAVATLLLELVELVAVEMDQPAAPLNLEP
jgi:hypothetical protein